MIVKGDATCLSIAAASILAKVTRDRMMRAEAEHYPAYDFARNKGYPCPRHKMALQGSGPSAIHRRTWAFMDDIAVDRRRRPLPPPRPPGHPLRPGAPHVTAVAAATALFDDLAAFGDAAADGASFDPAAIDLIADAGLHGVSVPKAVGGTELPLVESVEVWAEIARADGSIGWVAFAMDTALAYFGAYLPDDGVAELFADGLPRVAGQFAPNGTASADGDDWIVDGSYQFGSGITVADVAGCGFLATPPGGGDPAYLFGLPARRRGRPTGQLGRARAPGDPIGGLRAGRRTGAARHTFDFFAPVVHRGGPVARLGVLPLTAVGHAAWALGVTRRTLDECSWRPGAPGWAPPRPSANPTTA